MRVRTIKIILDENVLELIDSGSIKTLQKIEKKQCAECGDPFFQITKKEKRYCSETCMNRKRQRDIRKVIKENDQGKYESIKRQARNRAKKSYEKQKNDRL
jgi:poly-D-alanine transfer protein DltD